MENVTRVGIDLAKRVFHVTAAGAAGAVVERRCQRRAGLESCLARLPRGCVVAMDACGGAHHWARLASRLGHRAVLMSPQFAAPYVKSNNNDVLDAGAIAEASSRPTMRYVPVTSAAREHVQQQHRARQLAVRQRTALRNQIHGFLLEYGIESPRAGARCCAGWPRCWRNAGNELPVEGREMLRSLGEELGHQDERGRRSTSGSRAWRGSRRPAST